MKKTVVLLLVLLFVLPASLFAKAEDDLKRANDDIVKAIGQAEQGDLAGAKSSYSGFSSTWYGVEEGIKKKSKAAYRAIEDAMGEVTFAFTQNPVDQKQLLAGLKKLNEVNQNFISGNMSAFPDGTVTGAKKSTVSDLVALLDAALADLQKQDTGAAKEKIDRFRKSWLDIEGVVLTQSSKIYTDSERDMVTAYALLSAAPPEAEKAKHTIESMRSYLEPLAGKTSYTMLDAVTILLREGLEALLVVVALLGFLKKSGNESKKPWIWYGVGSGFLVSIVIGVIVQVLFSSGTFGSNNFLIAGCTGLFAGVMLLYMSYWLHSKSNLANWRSYINAQSNRALASGSLWSLAVLSFLAVFREGTETVLFFIGMASSIDLASLLGGVLIGAAVLAVVAFLVLKIGVKIPMRPFFLVSSILVFYLCFKFVGMGIHGLQLAGVLQATQIDGFKTFSSFALYPTWENVIPQALLLAFAVGAVLWNRAQNRKLSGRPSTNHTH